MHPLLGHKGVPLRVLPQKESKSKTIFPVSVHTENVHTVPSMHTIHRSNSKSLK